MSKRNLFYAQSGGVTPVINASAAGVIQAAKRYPDQIGKVLAGQNGILGALQENLIDTSKENARTIEGLINTPGGAFGSCRYKLKSLSENRAEYERLIAVFKAHNIGYFLYNGGGDSADTCLKVSQISASMDFPITAIHIPKTIDNDLVTTDHTPGYGSVIKHIATTIREVACDNAGMGQHDFVQIIEVMGRSAGWIAAGAALAKYKDNPNSAPHLIYLPEVPFSKEKYIEDVTRVLKKEKFCLVVVGEGLVDADGNYVSTDSATADAFGHSQLGGAGEFLRSLAEENLSVKARSVKLGMAQRAAANSASKADSDEAFMAGQAAVKAAVEGETDKMVILVRSEGDSYACETGLAPLSEIANGVKLLPESWINEDGVSMNYNFIKYALPLIQGEVEVPFENGVPQYIELKKIYVDKQLPAYTLNG